MRVIQKRFFTLLEILVVVFILSLGLVLTGVQLFKAYTEQRFLSETQQVLNHMQMAQDLMLILDTDVKFKIAQKREGTIEYWLEVPKPLVVHLSGDKDSNELDRAASYKWMSMVQRQIPLRSIKSFVFKEPDDRKMIIQHEETPLEYEKMIALRFSLGKISAGELILSDQEEDDPKGARLFTIKLCGYPSPIRKQKSSLKEEEKIKESERLYPKFENEA